MGCLCAHFRQDLPHSPAWLPPFLNHVAYLGLRGRIEIVSTINADEPRIPVCREVYALASGERITRIASQRFCHASPHYHDVHVCVNDTDVSWNQEALRFRRHVTNDPIVVSWSWKCQPPTRPKATNQFSFRQSRHHAPPGSNGTPNTWVM